MTTAAPARLTSMATILPTRVAVWPLVAACGVAYLLTTYGGIRSSDSEVVFRTAEALVDGRGFSVDRELEGWPGFGFSAGVNGELYSVFGPLESLGLVPFVALGRALATTEWYESIPVPASHYVEDGVVHAIRRTQPTHGRPHAVRAVASLFNIAVSSLCVLAFYRVVLRLTGDQRAGLFTAALLAFATPLWSYSGTLLSEPLAILLVILSLHELLAGVGAGEPRSKIDRRRLLWSGALLGLATTAHLSAILFAPLFALFVILEASRRGRFSADVARACAVFAGGLAVLLAVLALYNLARFGNPFETGRGIADPLDRDRFYGSFTAPWDGLNGLLLSPGKGIFFYVPIALLGLAAWPRFHARHRSLSFAMLGAVVVRLLFISVRSDWHGGWSLGPRYLMMAVPFLLLPIASAFAGFLDQGRSRAIGLSLLAGWGAMCQQWYFALGDVFTNSRILLMRGEAEGLSFDFYEDLAVTPLVTSLRGAPGSYLLGQLPLSLTAWWILGSVLMAGSMGVWVVRLRQGERTLAQSR